MENPFSRLLYRSVVAVVISGVLAGAVTAQVAKQPKRSKGPRALGLVEVLPNGRARLTPICIMVDGRFFDAGSYKADPVPMALESQTLYEGTRNGVSQGLFTVHGAQKAGEQWLGEGQWRTTPAPGSAGKYVPPPKKEDPDQPPVLRRGGSREANPPEVTKPPEPAKTESQAAPKPESKPAAVVVRPEEADRPILRRGTAGGSVVKLEEKDFAPTAIVKDVFPAVSDTGGAEFRPYSFDTKPEEIEKFRKTMLGFAADAVKARYKVAAAPQKKGTAPASEIAFKSVEMRVFDLSSSNEPTVVLSAVPDVALSTPLGAATNVSVTVIAREDIYGELKKLLAEATDDKHLDIHPRMELIDAVDADGDGSGKLLFRETNDSGRGFVIYRVGLDRLWELFNSFSPS